MTARKTKITIMGEVYDDNLDSFWDKIQKAVKAGEKVRIAYQKQLREQTGELIGVTTEGKEFKPAYGPNDGKWWE